MQNFILDPRLKADCLPICDMKLCRVLLMNDSRWPWIIAVPGIDYSIDNSIDNCVEIHHLSPSRQALLQEETSKIADSLAQVTGCEKINTGALGNIVRQLHIHVIARSTGDENWPGPVWGFGQRQPYQTKKADAMIKAVARKLA